MGEGEVQSIGCKMGPRMPCTTGGIEPIVCSNCKWSVTSKNCIKTFFFLNAAVRVDLIAHLAQDTELVLGCSVKPHPQTLAAPAPALQGHTLCRLTSQPSEPRPLSTIPSQTPAWATPRAPALPEACNPGRSLEACPCQARPCVAAATFPSFWSLPGSLPHSRGSRSPLRWPLGSSRALKLVPLHLHCSPQLHINHAHGLHSSPPASKGPHGGLAWVKAVIGPGRPGGGFIWLPRPIAPGPLNCLDAHPLAWKEGPLEANPA